MLVDGRRQLVCRVLLSVYFLAILSAQMTAVKNMVVAVSVGLLLFTWRAPLCPNKRLRNAVWAMTGLFLVQAISPAVWGDVGLFREEIKSWTDYFEALVIASLFLGAVSGRGALEQVLLGASLLLAILCLWAPLNHYLQGGFGATEEQGWFLRMCGNRGNPARFAGVVYLTSFAPLWLLSYGRSEKIPIWMVRLGYGAVPLLCLGTWLKYPTPPQLLPYFLACVAMIGAGVGIWRLLTHSSGKSGAFLVVALGLANVLLTLSRSVILTFTLTVLWASYALLASARQKAVLIILACLVALGGFYLYPRAVFFSSLSERVAIGHDVVAMIREDWLWGRGQSVHEFSSEWKKRHAGQDIRDNDVPDHAHNLFLQILYAHGVIGVAVVMTVWWLAFRAVWRHPLGRLSGIFLGTLVAYGMTDYPLTGSIAGLYWLIVAAGLSLGDGRIPAASGEGVKVIDNS